MIDRTPQGYSGETVARLCGDGSAIRRPTKAEAIEAALEAWPENEHGEDRRGAVYWIEIVTPETYDRERAEDEAEAAAGNA